MTAIQSTDVDASLRDQRTLAAMLGGCATGAGLLLLFDAGWVEGPLIGCVVATALYVVVSKLTFGWQPRLQSVWAQ